MDLRSALLVTGGSACAFRLLNTLVVRHLPTPEPARKKALRWRNITTSLIHSSLTGTWAILCLYLHPELIEDLFSSSSLFSHSLVSVSTGYFIYDFLDMAFNQSFKKSREMLLHHSVVIWCYGWAVVSRLFVGFAVVSLLVEINSVFLHTRQLLLLAGLRNRTGARNTPTEPSTSYRMTSLLNLGTFLIFRVCPLGWMIHRLASNRDMPGYVLMLGAVCLSLIVTLNTALFYRLLRADILSNTGNASKGH